LGDTDSIIIPEILSGTAVGIQTADNEPVTDVDLTATFINAPVRTISGQQGVAIQLLAQSPIAFDEIVFRDLTDAVAVNAFKATVDGLKDATIPMKQLLHTNPDRSHAGGRPDGGQRRLGEGVVLTSGLGTSQRRDQRR
jgi:hypothetical protein